MANGSTLPPQAYTREILATAFNWLQGQPESTRKLATSPDALVGLFLRAQRYGNSNPEADAPVSSQNFMSDLKNLAEGLKQFEDPKDHIRRINLNEMPQGTEIQQKVSEYHQQRASEYQMRATTGAPSMPSPAAYAPPAAREVSMPGGPTAYAAPSANPQPRMQTAEQKITESYPPPAPVLPNHGHDGAQAYFQQGTQASAPSSHSQGPGQSGVPALTGLSSTSLLMIREVKACLNLSSDAEAINMMVSIAYKNLKSLLN